MKRKNLLVLTTLLLTQTTPVWAMIPNEDDLNQRRAEHQRNVRNRYMENAWTAVENGHFEMGGHLYEEAFQFDEERIHPQNHQRENEGVEHQRNQRAHHDRPQVNGWNQADEERMRAAGNGQRLLNVQHRGVIPFLATNIAALEPTTDPINVNLGIARQRILCTYANGEQAEVDLPTEYNLHAQWCFQEDRDNTQNLATLRLNARINNQWRLVDDRHQIQINHILIDDSAPEIPGWDYFNGDRVYQARTKLQRWQNPRTGQTYLRNLSIQDNQVENHQGHEVIYAEPFAFGGEHSQPRDAYRGAYRFVRDLGEQEGLPGKKLENLIYSDENHIYLPKISQELWQKGETQVGFFIASYKRDRRLNFLPSAFIQENYVLPEGLYQIMSVQDEEPWPMNNPTETMLARRIENWQRLGENPRVVQIVSHAGHLIVPGMGSYAPRVIPHGSGNLEVLNLQENIRKTQEAIKKSAVLYPHVTNVVIVVGPSDAGKSTLIQGLAGKSLVGVDCGRGYISLDAEDPLPDFKIGQDSKSQTKIPGFWYDQDNNRLVIDCPGFEDSEGGAADIVNTFAIKEVFPNASVKVVLVAGASRITSDNGTPYAKLLNQMTVLYQDEDQLQQGLSVVLTKTDVAPQVLLRPLFSLLNLQNTVLTERSKNLLAYLNENRNRFFLLPKPQDEGEYHFDRAGLLNCINTTKYADNPAVNISVSADARELAGDLSQGLNKYLTNYIKTEGSQRIINYCNQLIDENWAAVTLRELFTQLASNLQNLSTSTPQDFYKNLKTVLNKRVNLKDIKQTIKTIDFLKMVKENISYNVAEWKLAFQDTITKIHSLIAPPTWNFENGVLSIHSIYTGAGEIVNILNQNPGTTQLNVCALNTLFLAQNEQVKFDKPGLSISFIAPQWKIGSPVTIKLSGADGLPGAHGVNPGEDGKPGLPGGNGGHFLGLADTIIHPELLNVNTSGGNGGPGGNGARGADGLPGVDSAERSITPSVHVGKLGKDSVKIVMEEHPNPPSTNKISCIKINAGQYVDSLSCFDNDGKNMGKIGGKGGSETTITFQPNEKLIGIFGSAGDLLDSIGFITNLQRYGPYGGRGGKHFERSNTNDEIIGFLGSNRTKKCHVIGKLSAFFINREKYETLGQPGGDGGQGGVGGFCGKPGHAKINGGIDWIQPDKDRLEGNSGSDGGAGEPGNGGSHGRPYFVDTGFQPNSANPASSGNRPNTQNRVNQQSAIAQPTEEYLKAERTKWHQEYSTFYQQQATNPNVAPFIKVFPNLK